MRVLVTGGSGFLGRHVVRILRERDHEVSAPPRFDCDCLQEGDLRYRLDYWRPDVVVHLAAVVGGIGANRERPADFLSLNARMGLHVLEACVRARPRPRVVMLGSICAYPKHCPAPFAEDSIWDGYPEETNAPYGIAKRLLLVAAEAFRAQYGLETVSLFPTNLYGPGDHFEGEGNHVVPALIARMFRAARREESPVTLWGDGSPTREFLYVTDAAAAVLAAVERGGPAGPLNLGSGEEVSIRDLAERIAAVVGFRGEIRWDRSRPNGQPRRLVDSTRARTALDWNPSVTLDVGLRRTFDWYAEEL